jgi:cobalt-zinc-cadmium efflux system membrane fusion protein
VLDNAEGQWRPGSFVTGLVAVDEYSVPLLVPRSALQTVAGQTVVFVETDEGFAARKVRVGRSNEVYAAIVDGLAPGQRYVVRGAFTLKAQLAKGSFGDGHGH